MTNGETQSEVYRTQYDVESDESLCYTLVTAVSAVTGEAPEAIEPLYESVDPDALEAVMRSLRRREQGEHRGRVEFTLHDCRVTVTPDGTIELRPPAEASSGAREDPD